ncbi:MAG: type II toxin-antitoxin system HicB family antitoxin [Ignavibacteria bacterium]|nr:type II toxin-antitoxin system HicB family antitoxin [Ignavibacteria bacterium]
MRKVIQFHIFKGEQQYVAEGLNVPIVTQGKSLDELVNNIKETVQLFLEDENLENYDLVAQPAIIANMELDSLIYA